MTHHARAMLQFRSSALRAAAIFTVLGGIQTVHAAATPFPGEVRIVVDKTLTISSAEAEDARALKLAITSATGLTHVAEYASYDVFRGDSRAVAVALRELGNHAISSRLAPELDTVLIGDNVYDPTSGRVLLGASAGPVSLSAAAAMTQTGLGLYVLTFDAFPLPDWLLTIGELGILILDPLPPASYIVYGARETIEALPEALAFIAGAFPLSSEIKRIPVTPPIDDSIYQSVVVDAVEQTPADSILEYLVSVAEEGHVYEVERTGARVRFTTRLTDVDIYTLAAFETVYTISSAAGATPSAEREGGMVRLAEPGWSLPIPAQSYTGWLASKGLSTFPNTVVGLVDTGFDATGGGNHPDFTSTGTSAGVPFVKTTYLVGGGIVRNFSQVFGANTDDISHGTLTTSIVSGYQPDGSTRKDGDGYRYALGIAPKVPTVMDKFFSASGAYVTLPVNFNIVYNRLTDALNLLAGPGNTDVINHSWNDLDGTTGCRYKDISQLLDKRTRTDNMLYVVSAGNTLSGCVYVRAPANAKNAIAVGATEIQTPNWPNKANLVPRQPVLAECNWNDYPSGGTAALSPKNVPTFSGRARSIATVLMKPDLMASGVRVTGPLSRDPAWQSGNGIFCNPNVASFPADGATYGFSAGTSFAAPAVSGAAAVVRQWYRNSLGGTDPSPAMTKAILINGARDMQGGDFRRIFPLLDLGNVVYVRDQFQGWGRLSFARLLNSAASYYWFDQGLTFVPGPPTTWSVTKAVVSSAVAVRVTLAYTDRFSSTLVNDQYKIVNDLDLRVCKSDNSVCWYGNALVNGVSEPRTPSTPLSDNVNNVEVVIVPAGVVAAGQQLVVTVTVRSLMSDAINPGNPDGTSPRQDFALFASNIH